MLSKIRINKLKLGPVYVNKQINSYCAYMLHKKKISNYINIQTSTTKTALVDAISCIEGYIYENKVLDIYI